MTAVPRSALDSGLLALQRRLRSIAPDASAVTDGQIVLEALSGVNDPPRLVSAAVLEGGVLRARRVLGEPEVGFAAFLDGTQTSRVVAYADGIPIIHGTVAAVIRARRNRRLTTWRRPIIERRLYAPRQLLSAVWTRVLDELDLTVVDTTPKANDAPEHSIHPFTLRDAAIHQVQADREAAEHELAERWCGHEKSALFIDGGISGSERIAVSECTVGVVKSHRTLYAEGDALQTIFRLRRAERSSVFRITSPRRTPVASWYLRMREAAGHDPMWGLLRVEIAEPIRTALSAVGTRADAISRWILAESAPLALPDSRWDKMAYGVRDCEEFLRAVT